jgi:hypothetical protein
MCSAFPERKIFLAVIIINQIVPFRSLRNPHFSNHVLEALGLDLRNHAITRYFIHAVKMTHSWTAYIPDSPHVDSLFQVSRLSLQNCPSHPP